MAAPALRRATALRIFKRLEGSGAVMDGGTDGRRITIHGQDDFAGMRAAGRLAAETLDMITAHVKPGVTTGQLDALLHDFMVSHGSIRR